MRMFEDDLLYSTSSSVLPRKHYSLRGRQCTESMPRKIVKKLLYILLFASATLGMYTLFSGIADSSKRSGVWQGLVHNMHAGADGHNQDAPGHNEKEDIPRIQLPQPKVPALNLRPNDDLLALGQVRNEGKIYIDKVNAQEHANAIVRIPPKPDDKNNLSPKKDDINVRNQDGDVIGQKLFAFGMSKKDIEKNREYINTRKKLLEGFNKEEKETEDLLRDAENEVDGKNPQKAVVKDSDGESNKAPVKLILPSGHDDVGNGGNNDGKLVQHKLFPFGMRPIHAANGANALPQLHELSNQNNRGNIMIGHRLPEGGADSGGLNTGHFAPRNLKQSWNRQPVPEPTKSLSRSTLAPDAAFFGKKSRDGEMDRLREFQQRMGLGLLKTHDINDPFNKHKGVLRPFGSHGVNPAMNRDKQVNTGNEHDAWAGINRDTVWGPQDSFRRPSVQDRAVTEGQNQASLDNARQQEANQNGNVALPQQDAGGNDGAFGDLNLNGVGQRPGAVHNLGEVHHAGADDSLGGQRPTIISTTPARRELQINRPVIHDHENVLPDLNPDIDIQNSDKEEEKLFTEDLNEPLTLNADCIPFNYPTKEGYLCIHPEKRGGEVSAILRKTGAWEPKTMQQFAEIILSDPTLGVIDIGAGIGVYTMAAAIIGRRVVAVEPLFINYRLLHKSALENHVSKNIVMVTQGLDKESYVGHMSYSPETGGFNKVQIGKLSEGEGVIDPANNVHVTTLDSLIPVIPFRKALLKLDVGGIMEADIMEGGSKLFKTVDIPYILTHWNADISIMKKIQITGKMAKWGYKPKLRWDGGDLSPSSLQVTIDMIVWHKDE